MKQTETKPTTDSTDTHWPPLAHIQRRLPGTKPKEGDRAICGAKLMGIDLEGVHIDKECPKCRELSRR